MQTGEMEGGASRPAAVLVPAPARRPRATHRGPLGPRQSLEIIGSGHDSSAEPSGGGDARSSSPTSKCLGSRGVCSPVSRTSVPVWINEAYCAPPGRGVKGGRGEVALIFAVMVKKRKTNRRGNGGRWRGRSSSRIRDYGWICKEACVMDSGSGSSRIVAEVEDRRRRSSLSRAK